MHTGGHTAMFRALFSMGSAAGAVVGASYVGRNWLPVGEEVLDDMSAAHVPLMAKIPRKIVLEYKSEGGVRQWGIVDAHKYSELVRHQAVMFEEARDELKQFANSELDTELTGAFKPIYERIPRFADWYFSYTTTYTFLSKVLTSTATNVVSLTRRDSLKDAVAHDIETMIQEKYKSVVLRPEISDPELNRAFGRVVVKAHTRYTESLEKAEREVVELVQLKMPDFLSPPEGSLSLDWRAQAVKSNHLQNSFEKTPETSLGLVAGGTLVGKTLGGMTASKTAASGLASKLAGPFLSGGGSGLGAAAGMLAGPGGAVMGASVGVGIDVLLNKGNEFLQRSNFEADVSEAVSSAANEWAATSTTELHRVIDVWINDSIQVLQYK